MTTASARDDCDQPADSAALCGRDPPRPDQWRGRDWGCLLLLAVLLVAPTGTRMRDRALDNHEAFVAVTVRGMLTSGDWVVPRFNGEPRLNKTPLQYWAGALASMAFAGGRPTVEMSRLPSLLGALLAAAMVFVIGRDAFSRRAGLMGAAIFATTLAAIRYGTYARPEMLMTGLVTLCFAAFWLGLRAATLRRQVAWFSTFWISLGLANLAKGPVPLAVVGGTLVVFFAVSGLWRKIPRMLPVLGPLLTVAVLAPWPLLLMTRIDHPFSQMLGEIELHAGGMTSGRSHHHAFFYYVSAFVVLSTPWWLFIPGAMASPFVGALKRFRKPLLLCWLWLVVTVIVFTLGKEKREHYILPAMPAVALMMGLVAEDLFFMRRWLTERTARLVMAFSAAAMAVVVAVVGAAAWLSHVWIARNWQIGYWDSPLVMRAQPLSDWILAAAGLAAALCVTGWALLRVGRPRGAFVALVLACAGGATLYMMGDERVDMALDFRTNGLELSRRLPPPIEICFYGDVEERTIFYVGRDSRVFDENKEGLARLRSYLASTDGPVVVVGEWPVSAVLHSQPELTKIASLPGPRKSLFETPSRVDVFANPAGRAAAVP
ncbi:MAG: Undecaprenyl phosphate-alpha-4-amino-4-deoxy-L-arabinose arabinosyl transferase [Phycisphaerae bacterium]|nr:Undecaprenyl phosphate-alpha-4-amino-4-deoxy-L-arabinose arabinosyl transferase [Phycisphaerae bacterium]